MPTHSHAQSAMSGRIPQQFIDDLLERVDIVDVIDSRVNLRKSGKNYSALCPFHDEKSPSFSVNPDKQFYYCFGCGAGGNAIGFLMEYERLDFPAAVEKLAGVAGVEVPREGGAAAASPRQAELASRLEAAAKWFQAQLRTHAQAAQARQYLQGRGLSEETIERFGIGFAPPGWDGLLNALGRSEADRTLLLDAGLLIARDDGGLYDRFRHRIMFPIRDNRGRAVAFGGRVLTDEKPKYLNSPETAIFHKSQELYGLFEARRAVRDLDRVLVVEGYMDVVMLAQHGINNATGTLGTSLTANHLQRLYRYTPSVVFCFDGDEAGRKAAARALELALPAMQDGRQASFLFLPEGEDPDSLVQRIGADAFRKLVSTATPLSEYLFEHYGQAIDLEHLDGRARLSNLLLPAINRIPGAVFRELMRTALAERVGMPVNRLPQAPGQAPVTASPPTDSAAPVRPQATRPPSPTPAATAQRRVQGSTRHAIRLLLQHPRAGRAVTDPDFELARDAGRPRPAAAAAADRSSCKRNPAHQPRRACSATGTARPSGELLTRLAAQGTGPEWRRYRSASSTDVMQHLAQQREQELSRREQAAASSSALPFAEMSPAQKQQYLELLQSRKK
jgi:DNA primase